jgi:hypothetical protein
MTNVEPPTGNSPNGAGAQSGWSDRIKGRIAATTALLLAVPALVNAAYDVYGAVRKVPRTEAERVNVELFQKYLHKEPLAIMPIPIKTTYGTADATFYIYEEGDVHVEYGGRTQWFALAKPEATRTSMSFMSSAIAAPLLIRPLPIRSMLSQRSAITGNTLIRSRLYVDGTFQEEQIDLRTGNILKMSTGKTQPSLLSPPPSPPRLILPDPIDLEKLRATPAK